MGQRFMFDLTNNRSVKIRKGEIYYYVYDQGFEVSYQEQPAHKSEKVHTHIWITNGCSDYIVEMWSIFHSTDNLVLPLKTYLFAFLTGFEVVDEKLDGPNYKFELVINRKLSKSLIDDVEEWFYDLTEIVLNRVWMKSLLGELDASS